MNINELVIDAYKTLSQSMFLTEVRPVSNIVMELEQTQYLVTSISHVVKKI